MADTDETAAIATDPKDMVLHLRTIHFSLIFACIGLYALITAGRSDEFDTALDQLDRIDAAVSEWDPDWLHQAALAALDDDDALRRSLGASVDPAPFREPFTFGDLHLRVVQDWTLLPLPNSILGLAEAGEISPDDPNGPLWSRFREIPPPDPQFVQVPRLNFATPMTVPLVFPQPQTLGDIEAMWNILDQTNLGMHRAEWVPGITMGPTRLRLSEFDGLPQFPAGPVTVGMRLEPILDPEKIAVWTDRFEHPEFDIKYHFVGHFDMNAIAALPQKPSPQGEAQPTAGEVEYLSPLFRPQRPQPARIEMLATTRYIPFNALAAFTRLAGLPATGSFAQTFPELSAVSAGMSAEYLDKVRASIKSKARQSEKQISLFGIDIPSAMVSVWGAPIVLVVQFYFLLHLRSFVRLLGSTRARSLAPWIGIYDDPVAQLTTGVSAALLPPGALFYVVSTASADPAGFLAPVVALSGLISFATLIGLRRTWSLLKPG
ncbi:MAG: hypothetical protein LJE68_00270 [Rhodobacter sp.]|nr:hypothetical protein [Rhodobacter sp.]